MPNDQNDPIAFRQEMEHFLRGYWDEERERVEADATYKEAAKRYDVVKAQERAAYMLETDYFE